ncbi:unnamed protein product [Paramecium sonneborni]|uniref:Uncharacterized protein n=1 Tax=Paramecium sonneborni TaxID=65129 RepID=A0A8S1N218_9CILI|nr:unnamed protein product [Paramecium sonneborni]
MKLQLIQIIAEKEEQLELNMQSFQSILKDELKEELTKIRTQERQKIEQLFQQNYSLSESICMKQKKNSLFKNSSEKQNNYYKAYKSIMKGQDMKNKDKMNFMNQENIQRFYNYHRYLPITQNSILKEKLMKIKLMNQGQDILWRSIRTLRYHRILKKSNFRLISIKRANKLEMSIIYLYYQIDQLKDNISQFQIQQDQRKRQRAEELEAIEKMRRKRTADRESLRTPYRQIRSSLHRTSLDRYPKDFIRLSNIQQPLHDQHQSSIMHKISLQKSQFISPKQENREITLTLQELDQVKYKYQSALNNILQLETQVIGKLQYNDQFEQFLIQNQNQN